MNSLLIAAVGRYFQKGDYEKTFDIGFELLIEGFEKALEERRAAKGSGDA